MIDVTHWGAPQFALIAFLFLQAIADQKAALHAAEDALRKETRDHPRIAWVASVFGALVPPVAVLCITCWGGFFA